MSVKSPLKRKLEIVRGDSKLVPMKAITLDCDNIPDTYYISSITEITVTFPLEDGTELVKTLTGTQVSVTDAESGRFQVNLTAAETATLAIGENQVFTARLLPIEKTLKYFMNVEDL